VEHHDVSKPSADHPNDMYDRPAAVELAFPR